MNAKLRVIDEDERCASPGKFRVITIIDSDLYQVGEDKDTLEKAEDLAYFATAGKEQLTQIFDDSGNKYIHSQKK